MQLHDKLDHAKLSSIAAKYSKISSGYTLLSLTGQLRAEKLGFPARTCDYDEMEKASWQLEAAGWRQNLYQRKGLSEGYVRFIRDF